MTIAVDQQSEQPAMNGRQIEKGDYATRQREKSARQWSCTRLGAAMAKRLVKEGAQVVLGDVLDEEGAVTAAALGEHTRFAHLDVTKPNERDAAVALAVSEVRRLDILADNAGIANYAPIDQYTVEQWDTILAMNLTGPFNGIKTAIPALKDSGSGAIVMSLPQRGSRDLRPSPAIRLRSSVSADSRNLSRSTSAYNIRADSVHPGK